MTKLNTEHHHIQWEEGNFVYNVYLFINYLTKITFPNRTWKMIKTADLAYLQTTMVFVY